MFSLVRNFINKFGSNFMKNHVVILTFLFFIVEFSSCSFKAVGIYGTNLAEGWRNYTDNEGNNVEVIPEIPRYQYFQLKWNGKVKWFYYEDGIKKQNGTQHWKMKADTVTFKYHSQRIHIDTVLFKRVNYADKYLFSYMSTDSRRDSRFLKKCFGNGKVYYTVNKYSEGY